MVTVVTREANGIPLTHDQVDSNFTNLADAVNNIGDDILGPAIAAKDAAVSAANSANLSAQSATNSANAASISRGNAASSAENASASAAESASYVASLLPADGSSKVGTIQSGIGTIRRTVEDELRDAVSVKQFDTPGGGADSTAGFIRALNHAALTGQAVECPTDEYLLSGPVLARLNGVVFNGNGSTIILASNDAGFLIAGSYNDVNGFAFSQSSQSLTPTAIKVFNDATTPLSIHNKIRNCRGSDVYRGVHVYMALNGPGQACYRQTIDDCQFVNKYLQKTWAGSFGYSFDGPNSGDAGGNDSRVLVSIAAGYERDYIINNSVTTQLINCSGDGAANCISYQGGSSNLQVIGGYYEYNDTFIETVGGLKYDLYLLYPSYANNTTFMTGTGVSFISGGMPSGVAVTAIRNGFFNSIQNLGTAEIDAANGTTFRSSNSGTIRATLDSAGIWTFKNGLVFIDPSSGLGVDKIQGYSGGSVPLDLSAANNVTMTTQSVERLRVNATGGIVALGPYNNTTAASPNMYVAPDGNFQRSTSSAQYKTDVELLDPARAKSIYNMRAVWYRSKCPGDRPDWSWYGFIAEELADLEPRLVHWGYSKYLREEVSPAEMAVFDETGKEISPAISAKFKDVPDVTSSLVPQGVQYERFVPLLVVNQADHEDRLDDLEKRIAALEEKFK